MALIIYAYYENNRFEMIRAFLFLEKRVFLGMVLCLGTND